MTASVSEKTRWDDARIVHDEQVAGMQISGEVPEDFVAEHTRFALQMQHPRGRSV
jgi:hypothetical protein